MFSKLLGGRPMAFVTFMFNDIVSGRPVNIFRDKLGRYWMAEHKWSLFRVTISPKSALYNKNFVEKFEF